MDQNLGWWTEVVFGGWRERPGPRYQRLAGALLDAVEQRVLADGTRVPAERGLADAIGVSRGTVVACFEHLVAAGVLDRRQGAGTFVVGRPSWADRPARSTMATLLLRRMAGDRTTIDLSVSAPGDLRHLPAIDAQQAWATLEGNGLDTAGVPELREAVADHLTRHQHLPTDPEQILITAGAQEALRLLNDALPPGDLVTTCPTYLGVADAFPDRRVVPLPTGPAGPDPNAVERAARAPGTVAYLVPTGHNPTGTVMPALPRQAFAAIADAGRATVVEDLSLADLYLDGEPPPPPLAALSTHVVAVGSAGKLLWGGLRVGWIRADEPLRGTLLARKAAASLATAATTQAITARLLTAIDAPWLAAHRNALACRRDHLIGLITHGLPGWRITRPAAGLSLWVEVPVDNVDAFAHTAARHGVVIAPGRTACVDGRHHHCVRLSFAAQFDLLTLAVDRLAVAWEAHSANLAAGPSRRRP